MQKRVESVKEIDFSGLKVPFIAVYQHPEDFPEKCVARIYELDKPTDTLMIKDTLEEIETDNLDEYMKKYITKVSEYSKVELDDGSVCYEVVTSGLKSKYTFTEI